MQQLTIIGNLGGDPETRFTGDGTPVCNFSVAVTEKFKNKSGEMQENVEWFRVVAWSKKAEICSKYLKKGSKVFVQGKVKTESWDDKKTGQKVYRPTLVMNEFEFLTPKDKTSQPGQISQEQAASFADTTADDMPF